MKRTFLSFILVVYCINVQAQSLKDRIIPAPLSIQIADGQYDFSGATKVTFKGFKKNPSPLMAFAERILSQYSSETTQKAQANDQGLVLELNKKFSKGEEAYTLTINGNGVHILSGGEKGLFYGLQTLVQAFSDGSKGALPFAVIEDEPRYSYRGLHLDVGRHMFPVAFIKTYIDLIASYKLNKFHWHLTEDQGWRIEIKKYPELTSVGGYRDQTLIGSNRAKHKIFDGVAYGGFYTQEEVKEVVAYAASKYITVIPEIEMPGHSLAALSAYPELACGDNPGPFKAAQQFGVFEDVYCAGKEDTYRFLEKVLDEVIALFPSEYIHIGGDESPKTKWKVCSHCQKKIKKEKLQDEHELQSYFISRMEKYLNKKGRQIIGWDEILEGGLAPNATVMSWRGTKGGIAAAKQNHKVVMTPSSHLYLDHAESRSKEEPLTIGHHLPLKKVYSYDPTSAELTADQQRYIIGVQGNVWTEYMPSPEMVLYMVLPRVLALSEIAWTSVGNKNWENFSEKRVPRHLGKVDDAGLNYRVPEPIGIQDTTFSANQFTLNLKSPVEGAKIYYTIDGNTPYNTSKLYQMPVKINIPLGQERTIKAVVITKSGKRSVVVTALIKNNLTETSL